MGDYASKTIHPKIFKAHDPFIDWMDLAQEINNLEELINLNKIEDVLNILKRLVTGYVPSKEIYNYSFKDN